MTFHVRGPLPRPGDHQGVDGFLGALGAIFELTDGDVKIEQLFCIAEGDVGDRVGARASSAATAHARDEQRVRLPVRRRSDRRDVDDLRRAGRQRVVLGLRPGSDTQGDRWTRLCPWATRIERGRDAFDRQAWRRAYEQLADGRRRRAARGRGSRAARGGRLPRRLQRRELGRVEPASTGVRPRSGRWRGPHAARSGSPSRC